VTDDLVDDRDGTVFGWASGSWKRSSPGPSLEQAAAAGELSLHWFRGGFSLLKAGQRITADLRLPGGRQHHLTVPRPRTAGEQHSTPASTLTVIDDPLAEHPADEAVTILNQRGLTGGWGNRSPPLPRRAMPRTQGPQPAATPARRRHVHPGRDRRPARRHPRTVSCHALHSGPGAPGCLSPAWQW